MEDLKKDTKEEVDQIREKVIDFFKKRYNWLIYVGLIIVLWFGAFIRTRNLPLLKDVTTGKYIPIALDPFLFLRYAREIIQTGGISAIDVLRYSPLGKGTASIEKILPYTIAYMYKFINFFVPSVTLELIDVIYPVIFFVLGGLMFFLLIKKLFDTKVALIATAILTVIPTYLYRTTAGFADKEPIGIFFMFTSMYFYILAFQSNKTRNAVIFGALAGISTGFIGLAWGGVKFALILFAIFNLVELLLNKFTKKDFYIYISWVIPTVIILGFVTTKYGRLMGLMRSFSSGLLFLVLLIALVDFLLFRLDILKIKSKVENRIPTSIISVIAAALISIIIISITFKPSFILTQINEILDGLLNPLGTNRWQITVAENHQPYFVDWLSNFGKSYIYLFLFGSILLFYKMIKPIKKHKLKLTTVYTIFLFSFIWSRYSSSSFWNGSNGTSRFLYIGSLVGFILILGGIYFLTFYKNKDFFNQIIQLDKKYIFIFIWLILMVVAARGAIRLFFVFAPVTAAIIAYLFVELMKQSLKIKNKALKVTTFIFLLLILLNPIGSAYDGLIPSSAKNSYSQAKFTGPSYHQQWQESMAWVRENTPEDSVFAHWWDYGYWVQTGGERATVLDGGNTNTYWNHLMGRHVMTGQTEDEALEFLKTRKATHFLIDPTDIGKYPAYSSIGADKDWDRYSWVGTYVLDQSQTKETRNQTLLLYRGGASLDDPFIYGDKVFPAQSAGIGGFIVPIQSVGDGGEVSVMQPEAVIIHNGQQTNVPLECIYLNGQLIRFTEHEGLKGCLRFIPTIDSSGQGNPTGAALYLSEEGTRALWARLYLLNEQFPNFKEVYNDQDRRPLALFNGRLIGPIRIWELSYPNHIEENEDYLYGSLPEWF